VSELVDGDACQRPTTGVKEVQTPSPFYVHGAKNTTKMVRLARAAAFCSATAHPPRSLG
jgi:hypothetical protein